MTSEVVAAYVIQNHVQAAEMPALIASVHAAFGSLGKPPVVEAVAEQLKPAVPIKKSVTDDYIISLEDGRKFKSMKRHLGLLGMSPADYRAKWGLSKDYPMVAPAYATQRSELAKTIGLGRKRQEEVVEAAPEPGDQPQPVAKKPGRRGGKATA
ncbi:MAG: MucR family transcriptional regulator [Janthinobacterium lividum]